MTDSGKSGCCEPSLIAAFDTEELALPTGTDAARHDRIMIWVLRIVLILVWIPAQYLSFLLGALGSLTAQSRYSDPGSVVVGVVGFVGTAVLALGGLDLSWRRPDLGAKVLAFPMAELTVLLIFALLAKR